MPAKIAVILDRTEEYPEATNLDPDTTDVFIHVWW